MNKTYILTASASYASGTILVVADSLEEIKQQVLEYHSYRKNVLLGHRFYDPIVRKEIQGKEWSDLVEDLRKKEEPILRKFPLISRISTGLSYIEKGKDGGGWFHDNWYLAQSEEQIRGNGWFVELEFMSDLPKGFHIVEDYCA